jgi:Ferritin-like domain
VEITERELLGMVREVDEMHHDGMRSFPGEVREIHHLSSRSLAMSVAALTIGGAALVLAAAPAVADDASIAGFAASVELTAVAAYTVGAPLLSGVVLTVAKTFLSHHQDHANAWNAAAGTSAAKGPNAKLIAALTPALNGLKSQNDVLAFAFGLENKAAATYQFALENVKSSSALQLAASIEPVEGQHAVVLGTVLGKSVKTDLIPVNFQSKDGFIDPETYPVS